MVRFNGSDVSTTYVSSSQLTATIPADKLTAAGTAADHRVQQPGLRLPSGFAGVGSNALTFTISNPAPTMGTLSPTSVWAGCVRTDIVLTVTGTNFVNGVAHRDQRRREDQHHVRQRDAAHGAAHAGRHGAAGAHPHGHREEPALPAGDLERRRPAAHGAAGDHRRRR